MSTFTLYGWPIFQLKWSEEEINARSTEPREQVPRHFDKGHFNQQNGNNTARLYDRIIASGCGLLSVRQSKGDNCFSLGVSVSIC